MDFISLELGRSGTAAGEGAAGPGALTEQLQTLIRGIGLHAIESEPSELAHLHRQLSEVAQSLTAESSPDDLMTAIIRTLKATEEYNVKAAGVFKSQADELRAMVTAMTETLQFIVSSSETSVKQLSFVELQLQRAQGLEDLRQLKTYTAACLNLVKKESTRLQVETRDKVDGLKQDVERLSVRLKTAAVSESEDPVTGLPGRAAAEQAIEERVAGGKPCVAALFLMERFATINGRFGNDVGDNIVMSCAQMLAKKLSGATLYRWSGPGFLAVFDPLVASAEAANRARQAAAQELQKNVEIDKRELMVVVSISCQVQPISAQTNPGELFHKLDGFMVAGQGQG